MKKLILFLLLGAAPLCAQSPQIPVTGTVGAGGVFPAICTSTVTFPSDANYTPIYPAMACSSGVMIVRSSGSLTATRNLVLPVTQGFNWKIENLTTGSQSIQVIGPSGTGVTIGNASATVVLADGANYVSAGGSGGGAVSSVFGRTGAVVAVTNDYSVGQVTGAAPLASPALTGTPTAPTPATSDNSTEIATTAYTRAYIASLSFVTGSGTSGHCVQWGASNTLGDAGAACGSGSGGATLQTNGANNTSQSTLNFTDTATVKFTNPSGGVELATVPTSTASALGVSSPDNSTIKVVAGVLTTISAAPTGTAGGDLSGTYPNPGVAKVNGGSLPTDSTFLGTNHTGQIINSSAFVPAIDLTDCTTAYLYTEGSGTTINNHCNNGSSSNGTLVGSTYTWRSDGIIMNQVGGSDNAYVQMPVAENQDHVFEIAEFFPYFGAHNGVGWGDATNLAVNPALLCGSASDLMCLVAHDSNDRFLGIGTPLYNYYNGSVMYVQSPTGYHVITVDCSAASGSMYYIDGIAQPAMQTSMCAPGASTSSYRINGSSLLTGTYSMGILEASVTYPTRTASQIANDSQALLNYMAVKSGTNGFSAGYSGNPPYIACFGDSRMAGASGGVLPCNDLALNDVSILPINNAFSGQRASDLCPASTIGIGDVIPTTTPYGVAVIWLGINDMFLSGDTGQQTAAYLKCDITNIKKTGAKVLVATEISGGDAGSITSCQFDPDKDQLDQIELAKIRSWGADGIINFNSVPGLGADGACMGADFQSDHLHPTAAAASGTVGPVIGNNVNELFGSSELSHSVVDTSTYQELAADDYLDAIGGGTQNGTIPGSLTANVAAGYVLLKTTLSTSGQLTSVEMQYQTAPPSPVPVTFVIESGSGTSWTIVNSFTVTTQPTTNVQRFVMGTDYAPVSVTSGEMLGTWSNNAWSATSNVGNVSSGGTGGFYLMAPTLPSGAQTYTTTSQNFAISGTVGGTAAQTITLPDCQGYTHGRQIWNTTSNAVTVDPGTSGFGSSFTQTINGTSSFSVPANTTGFFDVIPGNPSIGTCAWRAHL